MGAGKWGMIAEIDQRQERGNAKGKLVSVLDLFAPNASDFTPFAFAFLQVLTDSVVPHFISGPRDSVGSRPPTAPQSLPRPLQCKVVPATAGRPHRSCKASVGACVFAEIQDHLAAGDVFGPAGDGDVGAGHVGSGGVHLQRRASGDSDVRRGVVRLLDS